MPTIALTITSMAVAADWSNDSARITLRSVSMYHLRCNCTLTHVAAGRKMTEIMLWRRLDLPGHEIARLEVLDDGWKLFGTAIFASQRDPSKLDYVVICDATWRTQSAKVKGVIGSREIDVTVTVDTNRRWHLARTERTSVAGSLDIDLGFSPSTNLLPIRRLQLAVGDEAEVRAAWLPFPSFELKPLAQVYRRLAETTYRYESAGGRFTRTLEVNDTGFVTSYPGLWEAEAVD